jgi:hypothetical protein
MKRSPLLLRAAAILIAVAAIIDPVIVSARHGATIVAVVAVDAPHDGELADDVGRQLENTFTVVRGAYAGAAATVLVGSSLPQESDALAAPAFVVVPDAADVALLAVHAPADAALDARTQVLIDAHVQRAGKFDVTLVHDGAVIDRVVTDIAAAGDVRVPLHFVPAAPGPARLRVEARIGAGDVVAHDFVVGISARRWSVLFHDGRPSWQSTFVRRTLEQDARFAVSARVIVARDIATEFGRPQATLRNATSLTPYDVVVIGAPETLDAVETATLERFMRERGGSVLLLLDRHADGPYRRLTGATQWRAVDDGRVVELRAGADTALLRTAARSAPAALPAGAHALLHDPAGSPIVWRSAVGAGQLIVSGALDAWQHRDPESSRFEEFWPALMAGAASAGPPPLLGTGGGVTAPGEWNALDVVVRDVALASDAAPAAAPVTVTARVVAADGAAEVPLNLHPVGPPGELRAEFRAPPQPGTYSIIVEGAGTAVMLPLIVAASPARAADADPALLEAWALAHGGSAVPAARLAELPRLLQQALRPEPSPRPWHPMRSAWWLLPFTAALAGEWWWRRRRGLP